MFSTKPVVFSSHSREKMLDRGATESEVEMAIRTGSSEPAQRNRLMFRKNFSYGQSWRGKHYAIKQVAPVVVEEAERFIVVTVFVFYF
ncbi:MAG: DUF4258 domain-containing protein [Anaerolineales bacterium]|nr:DUF4258 domain-containing protein [Anaerolineales bacterium]